MRRAQDRARSARSRKNGARSATINSRAVGALKLASEARDENVPAKRADFFHYENAPFHTSNIAQAKKHRLGIESFPHPPYSSYVASCDYYLFPNLKR